MCQINDKLNKKQPTNDKYHRFYTTFVDSLKLLGVDNPDLNTKEVGKLWTQVIHFLIAQKFSFK